MNWDSFSVTDLSAAGILAIAVLMILRGKLVPSRVVDDIRADRDARLVDARAETDDWRTAYNRVEEIRRIQAQQLNDLLELAKTTDAFIRSLQSSIRSIKDDRGSP